MLTQWKSHKKNREDCATRSNWAQIRPGETGGQSGTSTFCWQRGCTIAPIIGPRVSVKPLQCAGYGEPPDPTHGQDTRFHFARCGYRAELAPRSLLAGASKRGAVLRESHSKGLGLGSELVGVLVSVESRTSFAWMIPVCQILYPGEINIPQSNPSVNFTLSRCPHPSKFDIWSVVTFPACIEPWQRVTNVSSPIA